MSDADVGIAEETRRSRNVSPFAGARRARWPRLRADVVAVVFLGGCAGGALRYGLVDSWPAAAGGFPWAVFAANVAGAFILPVVLVIVAELAPSRYLRPLVGTGFCGALTTFSSVVVSTDQLVAAGHEATGISYLLASLVAGLTAALLGLLAGRSVASVRHRARKEGTS